MPWMQAFKLEAASDLPTFGGPKMAMHLNGRSSSIWKG